MLVTCLSKARPSSKKQIESTLAEVAPEAVQIVGAKLIDHDRDDQLRPWSGSLGNGHAGKQGAKDLQRDHPQGLILASKTARARPMVANMRDRSSAVFQSLYLLVASSSRPIHWRKYAAAAAERIGLPPTVT